MKTRYKLIGRAMLSFLMALCTAFVTTSAFGQFAYTQTLTWGGSAGNDFGDTNNWLGNAGGPTTGTICLFSGAQPGNLTLVSSNGIQPGGAAIGGSYGASGFFLYMTASQTGSLQIKPGRAIAAGAGFNGLLVDSGAGQLILGDYTANQEIFTFRPSPPALHGLTNNSANPVIILPNWQLQNGGGAAGHVIAFAGSGNFGVTNNLRWANNAPAGELEWDGPGTFYWNAGGPNDVYNVGVGPYNINGGTLVVRSVGLFPNTPGVNMITNNGTLVFDVAGGNDTIVQAIYGAGTVIVTNGNWTLTAGGSTFSGGFNLNGGELIVNGFEQVTNGPLGSNSIVSFNGGTLGFSAGDTYDYSSRFNTAANQQYKIDTGGQLVTLATGLSSSSGSLTKVGPGTLTLAGTSSYTGATTVSAGKLVFQGSKTGTGNITLSDNTAAEFNNTGTQIQPATLTLGSSAGCTVEFDNISSTTTAPVAAGTLSSAGTITININSGTFSAPASYPLLTWTTGSAPTVRLGIIAGALGNLSISGNTLYLNVTALADVWNGNVDGNWTTANNWLFGGSAATYVDPNPVFFGDTALTNGATVDALVQPTNGVIIYNNNLTYTIASSGGNNISGGPTYLVKAGTATAFLSGGVNTYGGATTLKGGILSAGTLANGGAASDIGQSGNGAGNVVFDGGALQYTGGAVSIDRLFTLTPFGGTIYANGAGALTLNNTGAVGLSGGGARILTLRGTNTANNTLAAVIGDSGGGTTVNKNGSGTWVLTGANTYSGGTLISQGTLQVAGSGSLGAGNIVANGTVDFNNPGTVTINNTISGTGGLTKDGSGTTILTGTSTYSGVTTINGGTLQFGNGGATGSATATSGITNNGLLFFNTTGTFFYGGAVNGPGNVIVTGSGNLIKLVNTATAYTGWTLINPGATFQPCEGNAGALASPSITNNGTLLVVRQDTAVMTVPGNIVGTGRVVKDCNNVNVGDVTLLGTNTYTGGTIIAAGTITIGDGYVGGQYALPTNSVVVFTNSLVADITKSLEFNSALDLEFDGYITGSGSAVAGNQGQLWQYGVGTVTLTANNDFTGGTILNNYGIIQVGTNGTTGSVGSGDIRSVAGSFGTILFDRSDDVTIPNNIYGGVSVGQIGSGTLTLSGPNSYAGDLTVSNGTLVATYSGNDVYVEGGTLVPGPANTVGTLAASNGMYIDSGTIVVALNKSLAQSNSFFNVPGILQSTGGTLKLVNVGPSLQAGDVFQIFSQPVDETGGAITIAPVLGATFEDDLATSGSVKVLTALPNPTITVTPGVGGSYTLSWPSGWTGLHVQAQTNSLSTGLSSNWVTIPGTDASNSYTVTPDKTKGCVFYRLAP